MSCALIASCSNDDELTSAYDSDPNAVHVNATIGAPLTRVNTDGNGDTWTDGDQFFVTNTTTGAIEAKKTAIYQYSGSKWDLNGSQYMVWIDGENTFQAYYPYDATTSTTSYTIFTLPSDQSTADKLKSADWMLASTKATKTADKKSIDLTFSHQLAKVTIVINKYGGQYTSTPTLSEPSITLPTSTTTIEGKTISVEGSATKVTPYASTNSDSKTAYTAIVMPGSYTATNEFFSLKVGDDELKVVVPESSTLTTGLTSGKSYTLNLTVGKEAMTIGKVEVTDWNDGTAMTGGTADEVSSANASTNTINLVTEGALTEDLIKEALNNGTTLTIKGKMNYDDFATLKSNASGLTTLDLSGVSLTKLPCYTESITTTTGALQGMTALTTVTLPSSCTTLETNAFSGCTNLTTINGLDKITTVNAAAFAKCTSLTSLELKGATSIGVNAFRGCKGLNTLKLPKATTLGQIFANGYDGSTQEYTLNLESLELTAETFTSVASYIFLYATFKTSCTLTLHASQSANISTEDNACKWTPVSGTTLTLSDTFSSVICGSTQVWPKTGN